MKLLLAPQFVITVFLQLLCWCSNLSAATYEMNVTYLDLGEHFKGQAVFNTLKDKDGFAWIATRSTITRYDGRNMVYYKLNESDIITNADGMQTTLRFSPDGVLWAFTDNGKIFRYNADGDRFELYYLPSDVSKVFRINDLYIGNNGVVWMATTCGLYYLDMRGENRSFIWLDYLKNVFINSITELESGKFAINSSEGGRIVEIKGSLIRETGTFCEGQSIQKCYYDQNSGLLWIGTFNAGLKCWDIRKSEFINQDYLNIIPNSPVRSIVRLNSHILLAGLDGSGVYLIDELQRSAWLYLSDRETDTRKLKSNEVYDIFVDSDKIWVSTYTGGVTIVYTSGWYKLENHKPNNPQSLLNDQVHAILEDRDGDIWYATSSGISICQQNKVWRHFIDDGKTYLTLCEDHYGNIWCGGFGTGISCINKHRGIIRRINSLENSSRTDCIYASLADEEGQIWFGGLFNQLTCVTAPNSSNEKLTFYDIKGVNSLYAINKDSLLVCTSEGIRILDKGSGDITCFLEDTSSLEIETNNYIYAGINMGQDLWLATSGGGLICFNCHTGQITNYSTKDGLPSNFIYAILTDKHQRLWVSSGNGIFCFDPTAKKLLFNVADLPVKNFIFSSAYYLRDGDMVFGSTSGSFRFNPEEVKAYENTSNLVFTNFRVFYNNITPENNTDILSSRINLVETVKLKHNQNSFSIDFVSVDVYRSGNYVYKYKLEGFDTDWSPADSYMRADYTNIPPGNYKFSVMCIDQNSLSCVARKSVDINILSPFWNTAWAKLLYVILFSTFVYWIMKFYKTRSENLRFNDKINFFINVAHDIRTPLSLVIAPLKDMEKILGEDFPGRYYLNMALKNSNKLYSLVTRLLDFQKMEVALTKPSYSPVDVVSYLIQKADEFSMAGEKKNIIIETSLPSNAIFAKVDFERLDHILDNLISNAIKYSNKEGHVEIRMFLHGKRLFFEVEDNGIGIPRRDHKKILNDFYRTGNAIDSGEVGSGIGLAIARRLARQMNGKLSFTSQENYGSTFRLEIPYIEAADCMLGNDTENSTEQEIVQGENDYQEKECILVVEDGEDMRNYLVNSLSGEYKIFAVKSAEEALDFLQKKVVDVVLSDVMMSTMDGIELCRRLKMNFETSHLIVIMMTASIRHENVISAFESGADDYITKPFDIDVLRFKISNMLHTRRKMQQHYLSSMFLKGNKPAEQESVPLANSFDDEFLKKAIKLVTDNVDNSDFTINELCQKMAMSRTLLYEKLKAIIGQSPSEFIRIIRLRYAKELLMSGKYSVPTVATMTGFINAKYFSTVFKKYFGDSPSSIIPKKED